MAIYHYWSPGQLSVQACARAPARSGSLDMLSASSPAVQQRARYRARVFIAAQSRAPSSSSARRELLDNLRMSLWLSRPKEKSLVEARGVETSGSIHLARKQHSLNAMPSTPAKARAHTRDESVPLTMKSVSRTTEARVSTKRRNAAECAPSSKPPASRPTYASRKNAFALAQQRAGQRRQLLELQKIKCLASAPDRVRTPSKRQSKAFLAEV